MFTAILAAAAFTFDPAPCALESVPDGYEAKHGVECGWVTVPLRKDQPKGETIKLWTARIDGTGEAPGGDPVLYINGGPGIATVDEMVPYIEQSKMMGVLLRGRDLIVFDQRGSGRSEQALCPDLAKTLENVSNAGHSPAEEDRLAIAAYAACRAASEKAGHDLSAYSTDATVADIEGIRRALGIEHWSLAGISYGTLVALHAMRTNPATIRSVVLNSPFPPNSASWAEQTTVAAEGFATIARACSAQAACRDRFGDVGAKLAETLHRLEQAPQRSGDTIINGRQIAKALWPLAVRTNTVKYVPLAIDRAHAGDLDVMGRMVKLFAGGGSFGAYSPAQTLAIMCPESGRTADWYIRARNLYPAFASDEPVDGFDLRCAAFRPGYVDATFFAPVASDIPTLVYAGSFDPATPLIDAYQTIRFLPNATLVEVAGASHNPISTDECTLAIAAAFLDNPTVRPDIACLAGRPEIEFATEGLDGLLASMEG